MKKLLTFVILLCLVVSFSNAQNTWTFVSNFPAPNPVATTISVVNANQIWVACAASGGAARIYKTFNGGQNWILANGGLPAQDLYGLYAYDSLNVWVGTVQGSVYYTSNGGNNWTLQLSVPGSFCNGIKMFSLNYGVYYGDPTGSGQPYQFRTTSNGGLNWVLVTGAPIAGSEWGVINAWDWTDSNHFWIGSVNTIPNSTTAKIYKTANGYWGTWTGVTVNGTGGTQGCYFQAVAFIDNNNGLVGSSGGNILKTTNGGVSYTAVTPPPGLTSFAVMNMHSVKSAGIIRMAIDSGGGSVMYRTTNLGTSWIREQLPLQAVINIVADMEFLNENLGYGVLGSTNSPVGGLIKYGPTSGVNPINTNIPDGFVLEQNYPNPFNPGTTIKFSIPKSQFVTLKVFNSLGKEVQTLLSERLAAGTYEVFYDAQDLPSGIYFYKIITESFTDVKKMTLVK